MRRGNAITLRDVALEARVAKETASVVLNGSRSGTQVSEATRIRILEAAARLGYRPNGVARGLSRRRMDFIGVVAVCGEEGLQEYFLEVFNGIVQSAAVHGQNAAVFTIPGWEDAATLQPRLMRLCDGRVDGLIFLGPHQLDPAVAASVLQHTPLVAIHADNAPDWLCNADVDNEGGMYAVTRHLIELGHRRIAHLSGGLGAPFREAGAQERLDGYRRALTEAGLPLNPALVLHGDYREVSGRERTERLLHSGIAPFPTALCCANDAIAIGCMDALAARGLRVPADISVTGFDDIRTARVTSPPLTTVRQPFFQMGQRAVDLLLEQIARTTAGDDEETPSLDVPPAGSRTEVLPVELIVRGSTGPPPPPAGTMGL
mgnify:CR=1 FL=1|jgi:Transcriptional regulators